MTPTDALIHAAAQLDTDALLGREPASVAILSGVGAIQQPLPRDARDAARRHLAIAGWLRAFAVHEPEDRALVLCERADAQDVLAVLALATLERYAA